MDQLLTNMPRCELIEVNLSSVSNAIELHETLSKALGFPDWYGSNWDAFWDAITGLVEMPSELRFVHWPDFESRLPREAAFLRNALSEGAAGLGNRREAYGRIRSFVQSESFISRSTSRTAGLHSQEGGAERWGLSHAAIARGEIDGGPNDSPLFRRDDAARGVARLTGNRG
ncbi:MAG: barstar family protein [Terriglobales bacterium]